MKRYIRSTVNPFKMDTDTSYYNFLNEKDLKYMQDSKNKTGEIIMMSPNEYYEACAKDIFKNQTVESLKRQREHSYDGDDNLVTKYMEDMKAGAKFPLCFLNYADESQEGLHRMYAAGEAFGWDTKFPVLIVKIFDDDREAKLQRIRDCNDFERYDFEKLIEEACDQISEWDLPVPLDVCEQVKEQVEAEARKQNSVDIEVEVEIKMIDNHPRVDVYLTSYDGYVLPSIRNSSRVWLEDMYDLDVTKDEFDPDIYNDYYNR